jgi:hypothetical protein
MLAQEAANVLSAVIVDKCMAQFHQQLPNCGSRWDSCAFV